MSLLTTLLSSANSGTGIPGTIVAPVVAATTANFVATYANGASGIGATLTANSFGTFTIDGVSPSVGQRVLIKNQSTQLENGIYIVSATGGIFSSAVLTRATDFDEPSEITDGVLVEVANGTINSETLWQQVNTVTSVGVSAIAFLSSSTGGFTASRAVVTDTNGKLAVATTTAAEIGFVNGVTSAIQTQIDGKISQSGTQIYAVDSVGTDSYAITLSPVPSGYTSGMVVNFQAGTQNTGPCSLNLNGLGAKTIKKLHDQDTTTGDIEVGQIVTVVYDGTNFQMQSQSALSPATVTSVGVSSSTGLVVGSTPVTTSGTITVDLPNSAGGANLLFNPSMKIWQRGAGGAATFAVVSTYAYTADRWQCGTNGTQTMTFSQQAGPTSGSFKMRMQRNNGITTTGSLLCCQSLTREMAVGAAGNYLTFSLTAAAGANFSSQLGVINIAIYSGTGTTDVSLLTTGFTSQSIPASADPAITTTPTRYTVTTSSALGSTITQLAVLVTWTPFGTAGAADYVDISDLQLEIAAAATPFAATPFAQEQARCLFFYQKSFLYGTAPAQGVGGPTGETIYIAAKAGANVNTSPFLRYPVKLRVAPTLTTYSPVAATAQAYDETAGAACTGLSVLSNNANGFLFNATGAAGTAVGNALGIHWAAEAEVT